MKSCYVALMREGYSFQDTLAAMHAANAAEERRLEGARKYARLLRYQQSEAANAIIELAQYHAGALAARIIGGRDYEENTAALRKAARHAHPAARGILAEAADTNEANTPDTHGEARRLDAMRRAELATARHAEMQRATALAAARADRGRGIEIER